MLKYIVLMFFALLIFGCSTSGPGSDSFEFDFKPIAYSKRLSGSEAFGKGVELLRAEGFDMETNEVLLAASSKASHLGVRRWLQNNDKWDLSYQVGFQIIDSRDGQVFWRITHRITGTRSGESPRKFDPSDFKATQDIFSDLEGKISSLFSVRA